MYLFLNFIYLFIRVFLFLSLSFFSPVTHIVVLYARDCSCTIYLHTFPVEGDKIYRRTGY